MSLEKQLSETAFGLVRRWNVVGTCHAMRIPSNIVKASKLSSLTNNEWRGKFETDPLTLDTLEETKASMQQHNDCRGVDLTYL